MTLTMFALVLALTLSIATVVSLHNTAQQRVVAKAKKRAFFDA